MKSLLFVFLFFSFCAFGQIDTNSTLQEIKEFQVEQDNHYSDKEESPLLKKERRKFKGHSFYPVDMSYCVVAKFLRIAFGDTVIMKTSSNTEKVYVEYALLQFKIKGTPCELTVYQSVKLSKIKEFKDYLFIPFKDATSGKESYGGGRYLDILIPKGNEVILNFNLAYNPYCAYTNGYYCPIPPIENTLNVVIQAGLMAPKNIKLGK